MLEPAPANPWRVVSRREIYRNPWTVLLEDRLEDAAGRPGLYGYLAAKDWVIVCPLHADESVTLVRQWRHAFGCSSWELPCGACEGREPEAAARQELAEETRLQAASWRELGAYHNSDARVGGRGHAFLASGLQPVAEAPPRDATESDLIHQQVPLAEALAACEDGRIRAISTVCVLLRVARLLGR